jgi:hypothetical protein
MSKERELLKRCFEYIYPSFESNLICDEIEELLAQPEHIADVGNMVEQEPVAWMYDWNTKGDELYWNSYYDRVSSDEMAIKRSACDNIRPLYTSPPKRESLSDDEIRVIINQLPTGVDLDTGIEFCKIIEKAHGITGVDDE